MKTFKLFLISFLLISTITFGQSNDEKEIRRLEKLWTELLDKGDTTIAIVMGKELQQLANMTSNKEDWIPRRFTNVWIKSEMGWQLVARQSSEVIRK